MTYHLTGHGPAKYRKKPAVVEAMQFLGRTTKAQILDFCPGADVGIVWPGNDADIRWLNVRRGAEWVEVRDGDWIVRDDDGFRRVQSAIFAATYEAQDATTGRLTPGTGGSEAPPVSGPENAYKCAHCGRVLGSFEAGIARIGTATVCHPNDDGPDCYRLVTVYGEKLGARR